MTSTPKSLRWAESERRRRRALLAPLLIVAVGLSRIATTDGAAGLVLWLGCSAALTSGVLLGICIRAQRRLRHLEPGERWVGSASVDIDDLVGCATLATAAPVSKRAGSLAFPTGVAPGTLRIGDAGLTWQPGRLARRHGAQGWTVDRAHLVAVETGRYSPPFSTGVLAWFLDGTSVSFQTQFQPGLADALRLLELDRLPTLFAEAG